jgi:hypothetical protein
MMLLGQRIRGTCLYHGGDSTVNGAYWCMTISAWYLKAQKAKDTTAGIRLLSISSVRLTRFGIVRDCGSTAHRRRLYANLLESGPLAMQSPPGRTMLVISDDDATSSDTCQK